MHRFIFFKKVEMILQQFKLCGKFFESNKKISFLYILVVPLDKILQDKDDVHTQFSLDTRKT